MKPLEQTLRILNAIHYDKKETEAILRRNVMTDVMPKQSDCYTVVSGAEVFSNDTFIGKIKYPGQLGDAGFYLGKDNQRILAMTSFNLDFQEDSFSIVQIQGTRTEYLESDEKNALRSIPWEMSLRDVVEKAAQLCEAGEVRIISSQNIPAVREGRVNARSLAIRYDVSAIVMGYFPLDDNSWYVKSLN